MAEEIECIRASAAYVYARETKQQADIAKVLTFDEPRRIACERGEAAGVGRDHRAARRSPCPKVDDRGS
jgi:hypothetical protein